MKKFLAVILAGIMMLGLAACGSGGGSDELSVGVFYYTYSDTYIPVCVPRWMHS